MSIITVDGHLIHYEVLGRGQPLIFIHGWLGSWRYWWPSMQALSAQYRCFAFDLWGFGDSSKAPEKYTMGAYVAMMDQFIDQLGIALPVTLVGHALGAAVALRYTLEHPDNIDKLITVSLPVTGSAINERLLIAEPDAFIGRVLGKANSFAEIDTEVRKTDQLAFNQLARELAGANNSLSKEILDAPRPLLMVYGGQDTVIQLPTDNEQMPLTQSAQNRFFVALEQCHHFPMLQEKAKFNRLLLEFIVAGTDLTELAPKEYWQRRVR